ncbi:MAG: helix-turn-helix transcriptional regulator [Desulfovibrio sp.]|jgi:DNA-binding XRE family transcriptional regulator|nr:helix-turn-helix transcriptional regulator [Desulfovibrio sp.]MDR3363127.1 helix-turn-helix transcriptional regulator [Desulfovibrio sp.]
MSALTDNHQIVRHNGVPVAVVIPYAEYRALVGDTSRLQDDEVTIPHEVLGLVVKNGKTPVAAWREYLGLTQAEVASRMGIAQPSYARMENAKNLRIATLKKIAGAMKVQWEQLEWE